MSHLPFRRHTRRFAAGVVALAVGLTVVPYAQAAAPSAPIKIIQNYSETLEFGASTACGGGDNQWYRRFDLAGNHQVASGFSVDKVVFGTQEVGPLEESITLNVAVKTIDPGAPMLLANLETVSMTTLELTSENAESVLETPLAAVVPPGKDLVVEISTPGAQGSMFIGGNKEPESFPAYLMTSACSVFEPTTTDELGFPDSSLMFYATGKSGDCLIAEAAVTSAEKALATADRKYTKAKKKAKKAQKKMKKAKKTGKKSEKYKKALKKYKKAKKALKKSNKARKLARAKLAEAQATAAVECAQPMLPALPEEEPKGAPTRPREPASTGLSSSSRG